MTTRWRLASAHNPAMFHRMKFVFAMLTFGLMALVLGAGIVKAAQPNGSPWLLVAGILGYVVLFWRVGCAEEH